MKVKSIFIIAFTCLFLLISLVGCTDNSNTEIDDEEVITEEQTMATSDLDYVKQNKVLKVGVVNTRPINYIDENEQWIGIDVDIAKAFADYLGTDIEFVQIDWDNKTFELDSKAVDCICNSSLLTDKTSPSLEWSREYINNSLVLVTKAEAASNYEKIEDCAEMKLAVLKDSEAKALIEEAEIEYIEFDSIEESLNSVINGNSDGAVIENLFALQLVGEDKEYENLSISIKLNTKTAAFAFRKGSDIAESFNKWYSEASKDGFIDEIAARYMLESSISK